MSLSIQTAAVQDRSIAPSGWTFSPDRAVEDLVSRLRESLPSRYPGTLDHFRAFLERLGSPHRKLPPVFHVAGTNGKGSTLAFLQAAFESAGLSVHKFTSPHLVRFEERIVVNGRMIGADEFLALAAECEGAASGLPVSFFEFFTAVFFLAASRNGGSAVLLETGVGGTRDATNVVDATVPVLTRVSFDHMKILGHTLPEIAATKAGILRAGLPAVVAPQPGAGVMQAFEDRARALGAPLLRAGSEWRVREEGSGFSYEGRSFSGRLPLPALSGEHQVINAGTAIAALEAAGAERLLKQDVLAGAMRRVTWPARMQRLKTGPMVDLLPEDWEIWLDGAHNDSGAEILARHIAQWRDGKPLHIITALKSNKDAGAFYRPVLPHAASVQILDADIGAPMMPAAELRDVLARLGFPEARLVQNLESAVLSLASQPGGPRRILIAGSLYLAGYVLRNHG